MILASAGSGKTYELTNRYVALLAGGASPERIAALTFTRKAAGEFFDKILGKLAAAAADAGQARKLAAEISSPELRPEDFGRMLRGVVDAMHQLSLGTLDGFFARIVRAFPLELGLGGDFDILPEQAAKLERRRALRELFAASSGVSDAARRDFIEAFKRATFGAEEKNLSARLDAFVDENVEYYLAAPDPIRWGREEAIWPGGCPWLTTVAGRAEAARELEACLPWSILAEGQEIRWRNFFLRLPEWQPGAELPDAVAYIVDRALDEWPEAGEMTIDRKRVALPPQASSPLRRLVSAVVGAELARRMEMTQGLFAVLASYESVYDAAVRRSGRLTFSDLLRLLQPDGPGGAPPLSQRPGGDARLFIDWRLDAQIDHWLLDEFQDTSFGQWSVLRNLIDEAVQDPTGSRTFFYVGDAKQAIYTWRGGDPRLFREIFNHYNPAGAETIRQEHRARSFRSGPAVIAMVNRVFGATEALGRLFPAAAVGRWADEWRSHETAHPNLEGYAELSSGEDQPARFAETLRILQRTEPLARGLDAAILVRTNKTAAALADYLRSEGGLPAVAGSDLRVGSDNPLASGILALFRAAAHPGDRGAWGHVVMTPLFAVLEERGLAAKEALSSQLPREIHTDGFEQTIVRWLALLEPRLAADDRFSRERGRQLAVAGRQFDATGSRDLAEFAEFAEGYAVRDAETAGIIRVMTVHKAKGLDFDLVILPDLEGQKLAQRRDEGPEVQRAADRSVEWVFQFPQKEFWRPDPVLSEHVAEAEADACYENLCLLYVAMTRAKRALYVITKPVGKSQSHNFPRLLRETLGDAWSEGDAAWHQKIPLAAAAIEIGEAPASQNAGRMRRAPRRPARRPSAARTGTVVNAAALFALERASAADLGAAVHALLAQVEWIDGPAEAARFEETWRIGRTDPAACALALAGLRALGFAQVWARPAGPAEVWRERPFEAVLDGAWVTGVFDRVVIARDASGRATAASVFDFKTDRIAGPEDRSKAEARHAPQLDLYRRAAGALLGLPPGAVTAEPVFLQSSGREDCAE
jgi:ATP-dependent exoDNAse (exonuclease V) beta subunit